MLSPAGAWPPPQVQLRQKAGTGFFDKWGSMYVAVCMQAACHAFPYRSKSS